MRYDEDKYKELAYAYVNYIMNDKTYILPILVQNFAMIELVLVKGHCRIESQSHPIRHGKHCGSTILLGFSSGIIDLNPKLIWNGKEWLLNTFGTFIFAEIEINAPSRGNNEDN